MTILHNIVLGYLWLALWAAEIVARLACGEDEWPGTRKRKREYDGT